MENYEKIHKNDKILNILKVNRNGNYGNINEI